MLVFAEHSANVRHLAKHSAFTDPHNGLIRQILLFFMTILLMRKLKL